MSAKSRHKRTSNIEEDKLPEDSFPPELQGLLKNVPQDKRRDAVFQLASFTRRTIHSGPLPPPEVLEKYSAIIPNGAERIMQMAENQNSHRIAIEKSAIKSQSNQSFLGQIFGFTIGIVALLAAWHLAINGHNAVAGIIGGTTVVGLVSVFIIGKTSQSKQLEKKE
ncbi:MAG: DUF2335 domain-containing protein [Cytophagaceae bacterium]